VLADITKVSVSSRPLDGVTANVPGSGGPLVVNVIAVKPVAPVTVVQVRVKVTVARGGRALGAMTRLKVNVSEAADPLLVI
jgi:hypothetical protein